MIVKWTEGYGKQRGYEFAGDIMGRYDEEARTMRDEVKKMLRFAEPFAEKLGTIGWFDEIESILENGNGADDTLALYDELNEDMTQLQKRLIDSVEYELEEQYA